MANNKSKAIEAIKEVRKMEEKHYQKWVFCREHNMKLDELMHQEIETELRRVCFLLQDLFDTGYVGLEKGE